MLKRVELVLDIPWPDNPNYISYGFKGVFYVDRLSISYDHIVIAANSGLFIQIPRDLVTSIKVRDAYKPCSYIQ